MKRETFILFLRIVALVALVPSRQWPKVGFSAEKKTTLVKGGTK